MIKIILLVFISELFAATGHFLFKKSTNTMEFRSLGSLDAKLLFIKTVISKPAVWLGMLSIAIGLVIWIFALAGGDLSVVYPLSSVEYILVLFSAHFLLGEKIDRMKMAGTILVMLGIVLITMS